ncbi:MAG: transglutaminase domain-containing protein [Acidobacteria bacterium]|nr:transglutaminase domain-containing protein [Acidobacteriota bacterium]
MEESEDGVVHVKVDVTPLRNSTPYPAPIKDKRARAVLDSGRVPPLSTAFRETTRKLVQPCYGYFQAVSTILNWITHHFHYQLQSGSLLEGDCTAAAKLTVQMLSEAGIPARTVTGVVVETENHVLSGKALHSFVEIYYPATGWLFSDPLSSYHYVPANYVLLNDAPASHYFGLTLRAVRQPTPLESVITNDRSGIPGRINLFRFN